MEIHVLYILELKKKRFCISEILRIPIRFYFMWLLLIKIY